MIGPADRLPLGVEVVEQEVVLVGLVDPDVGDPVAVEVAGDRDRVDAGGVEAEGDAGPADRLRLGVEIVEIEVVLVRLVDPDVGDPVAVEVAQRGRGGHDQALDGRVAGEVDRVDLEQRGPAGQVRGGRDRVSAGVGVGRRRAEQGAGRGVEEREGRPEVGDADEVGTSAVGRVLPDQGRRGWPSS